MKIYVSFDEFVKLPVFLILKPFARKSTVLKEDDSDVSVLAFIALYKNIILKER